MQVAFDLYARSAVGAAAFDAVRIVAGADAAGDAARDAAVRDTSTAAAEARARDVLGGYGARAEFEWTIAAGEVELTVRVPNPGFLPPAFRVGGRETLRTVRMRVERER